MHASLTSYHVKSVMAIPPHCNDHDKDSMASRQHDDLHP